MEGSILLHSILSFNIAASNSTLFNSSSSGSGSQALTTLVRLIPVVGGGEKVESESMGEKVVRACEPDPEELDLVSYFIPFYLSI
jgi:hypothetical protein